MILENFIFFVGKYCVNFVFDENFQQKFRKQVWCLTFLKIGFCKNNFNLCNLDF